MAEITEAGYQDLRDYVEGAWSFVEIRDDSAAGAGGAAVVRLDPSDPRVEWVHAPSAQVLQIRVTLRGDDGDITPPVTLRSAALYDAGTGGSAYAEEVFSEGDAVINSESDEVTVTFDVEVPQLL